MIPRREGFAAGDAVLLVDNKGRRHLVRLAVGGIYHFHNGWLRHDDIIGQAGGLRLTSSGGTAVIAVRPTLADFILEMPRQTQVIYPKDLGPLLVYGDIFPGATVLEAGIGSAALTLELLRAVGPGGRVISYEARPEMARQAQQNIVSFLGELPANHEVRIGDIYADIANPSLSGRIDRVLLDVPEPWRAVPAAATALAPDGIFVAYLPTTLQLHQLGEALHSEPDFALAETFEVLLRPWDIAGRSVRPAHRMVAHTGFITVARRVARPQPTADAAPRYRLLEHTADVGVEAYGDSVEAAFAAAAEGMFSIIADLDTVREIRRRRIVVDGPTDGGLDDLLVAWLSELLYVFEVDGLLFRRFEVRGIADGRLRATAIGEPVDAARHRLRTAIKAVTYHMLEVAAEPASRHGESPSETGGWRVRVIFDI